MRTRLSSIIALTLIGTQSIAADLPKSGSMNTMICYAGAAPVTMPFSKDTVLGTLHWSGAMWNPVEGGAFDAMAAECAGHFTASPAGQTAAGQCQFADAQGDKFLVDIPENKNGAGKWNFAAGTGKYQGIKGAGTFKPLRHFPPAITVGQAIVCYTVSGQYSLQ